MTENGARVTALTCPQCGAAVPATEGYVICQYCGSSLVVTTRGASDGSRPQPRVFRGMKLTPYTMQDPGGTGLPVFCMLVPVGWEMRGGVTWDLTNVGQPATVQFQLWNPRGLEAFEIHPNMNFTGGGGFGGLLGGKQFGIEVRRPVDAQTALRELVVPRYRGGWEALQVVRVEPFPELAQIAGGQGAGGGMRQTDAARARITYRLGGYDLEEEFWAVVEVWRTPMAGMFMSESVFWYLTHILSFRGGAGKLEATKDLFEVLVRSIKVNRQWKAAYEQVVTALAQGQISHIRIIGQIGSQYAQAGAQMRAENLEGFYARSASQDHYSREWSEAIRGVETYWDPNKGMEVELPSQYQHAWTNSQGEYIVTDSDLFNPNVDTDTTLNWEPLQPMP